MIYSATKKFNVGPFFTRQYFFSASVSNLTPADRQKYISRFVNDDHYDGIFACHLNCSMRKRLNNLILLSRDINLFTLEAIDYKRLGVVFKKCCLLAV